MEARDDSGKVRLRRSTSAKKAVAYPGQLVQLLTYQKNIYGFVSRALKNKCPKPIIYDSTAVVAEFRFCSVSHNLLEKFVDVVGSLIFNYFLRDTPVTVE